MNSHAVNLQTSGHHRGFSQSSAVNTTGDRKISFFQLFCVKHREIK